MQGSTNHPCPCCGKPLEYDPNSINQFRCVPCLQPWSWFDFQEVDWTGYKCPKHSQKGMFDE